MSPHRVVAAKAAGNAVVATVQHVFDLPLAVLGIAVGTSATVVSNQLGHWLVPGYFLGALLLMSTLEILTCYFSNPKAQRRAFNWERVITGKFLLVSLVLVAMLLDGMLYFGSRFVPGDWEVLGQGILPITISSLTWFLMAEAARTVRNVARSEGDSAIPPVVLWVVRQLRKVDEKRYGEQETPAHRWTDDLTVEQIEDLLKQRRQIDGAGAHPSLADVPIDPPPPPLPPLSGGAG